MPCCPHGDQCQVESLSTWGRYCSTPLSATLTRGPSTRSARLLTAPRRVMQCQPGDLNTLERWANANLMKFNKAKCWVLYPRNNPRNTHRGGQKSDWEQPCGEGLGMMVDENSTWAISVCSQPRKPTLGCTKKSMDSRPRQGILPLYPTLAVSATGMITSLQQAWVEAQQLTWQQKCIMQ